MTDRLPGHPWPPCYYVQSGLSSPASTIGNQRTRLAAGRPRPRAISRGHQRQLPIGRLLQECAVPLRCVGVGHPMVALVPFFAGDHPGCQAPKPGMEALGRKKYGRVQNASMRDAGCRMLSGGKRALFRVGPRQTRCRHGADTVQTRCRHGAFGGIPTVTHCNIDASQRWDAWRNWRMLPEAAGSSRHITLTPTLAQPPTHCRHWRPSGFLPPRLRPLTAAFCLLQQVNKSRHHRVFC